MKYTAVWFLCALASVIASYAADHEWIIPGGFSALIKSSDDIRVFKEAEEGKGFELETRFKTSLGAAERDLELEERSIASMLSIQIDDDVTNLFEIKVLHFSKKLPDGSRENRILVSRNGTCSLARFGGRRDSQLKHVLAAIENGCKPRPCE